jgi:hypothetical protein
MYFALKALGITETPVQVERAWSLILSPQILNDDIFWLVLKT